MDTTTRTQLEARVVAQISALLARDNPQYWRSLSRPNFVHTLTHALSFRLLHRHDDAEARALVQRVVEQHVDQWRATRRDGEAEG